MENSQRSVEGKKEGQESNIVSSERPLENALRILGAYSGL